MNIFRPTKRKVLGALLIVVVVWLCDIIGVIATLPLQVAFLKPSFDEANYLFEMERNEALAAVPLSRWLLFQVPMTLLKLAIAGLGAYLCVCMLFRRPDAEQEEQTEQGSAPLPPAPQTGPSEGAR